MKVEGGNKFLTISVGPASADHSDNPPAAHTCGITVTQTILCWGLNSAGQLGNGSTESTQTPTPVTSTLKFRSVSAGFGYTCALSVDGAGYCWGLNAKGQLGNGTLNTSTVLVPISQVLTFK
ncbi:MAG TPA: hypothetical protein VII02_14715 [Gemmatimonadaceae bacterium]